jgi:hypothetical protein
MDAPVKIDLICFEVCVKNGFDIALKLLKRFSLGFLSLQIIQVNWKIV